MAGTFRKSGKGKSVSANKTKGRPTLIEGAGTGQAPTRRRIKQLKQFIRNF